MTVHGKWTLVRCTDRGTGEPVIPDSRFDCLERVVLVFTRHDLVDAVIFQPLVA